MQIENGQNLDAETDCREEVRTNILNSGLASRLLREGLVRSKECPSQTDGGKPLSDDTKVTSAGAINSVRNIIGDASPRDKPEREASASAIPSTLRPPTLIKDGGPVTGALKHQLKNQNKQQKLRSSSIRREDPTELLPMA